MTEVRLVLEHTPSAQAETEKIFHGGQLTVGRGADADWRIHDPANFVSRKHFVLSSEGDEVRLTDASSGGLFVDGADEPLGPGNSVTVEHGMRLRFGDFLARVEMGETVRPAQVAPKVASSPFDFTFEPAEDTGPAPERPDSLPEPFGQRSSRFFRDEPVEEPRAPEPIDRDNPFALGLKPATPNPVPSPVPEFSGGGYFDVPQEPAPPKPEPEPEPAQVYDPEPEAESVATPHAPAVSDAALRVAFFRGMGLDPAKVTVEDTEAEMEAIGKRFRALADGLTHLLRTRAAEKQKVRLAQTIVGSSNVNPLKFAVSVEEAVLSLIIERGPGYLDPGESIDEAFRDLVDHQMRTWAALQAALRRMIDKFDPDAIERELENTGLLETLIVGGRSAKLWQLYEERYEEIARAAEERFLGEIGADFREAYEDR